MNRKATVRREKAGLGGQPFQHVRVVFLPVRHSASGPNSWRHRGPRMRPQSNQPPTAGLELADRKKYFYFARHSVQGAELIGPGAGRAADGGMGLQVDFRAISVAMVNRIFISEVGGPKNQSPRFFSLTSESLSITNQSKWGSGVSFRRNPTESLQSSDY